MTGTDGRTCNVVCFRCQAWGHYADECPNAGDINNSGGVTKELILCSIGKILIKEMEVFHMTGSSWIYVRQILCFATVPCWVISLHMMLRKILK